MKRSTRHITMNGRILFSQQFPSCVVLLAIGWIGVATNPVLAQQSIKTSFLLVAQSPSIQGSWRLVNMTESALPTPMVPDQTTALTADFSDGRIWGSGGCNRFMGDYQIEGEQLNIGPLASTFMACESTIMDQETRYLKALQGAQRYEVDNQDQLAIFYQTEETSGVLRFAAQNVRGLW